jgi:hypothetical protein
MRVDDPMDNVWCSPYSPEVHEAAGMIAMQASCVIGDAISMMWERADADDVSIDDIAAAVIARSISFRA